MERPRAAVSRIVVIGAGLGGLAVAARLARLGHEVVVCERSTDVGGKVGVVHRDGFTFDTGPSLITLPAALRDLFLKTGKGIETVLDLQPLPQLARCVFPDGVALDVPNTGVVDVARAFQEAFGGRSGEQWRRFHDRAGDTWDVVRGPFVESAPEGRAALLRLATRRPLDMRRVAPGRTLSGLARRSFDDERLRMFVERYATYAGSDPRRSPAVLSVIPYVEQTFGGWYIDGGIRRVADAMQDRAHQRGVVIRAASDVTSVTVDGGRVSGVTLRDGEHLAADVVVSTIDASVLYGSLLPDARQQQRLASVPSSLSGFTLLLGLRGRSVDMPRHTVLFGPRYHAEFDAIFGRDARPVEDPTIYVATDGDDRHAPDGHEAWFVLVNAAPHGTGAHRVDWNAPGVADSYADHVLATMAARGLDVRDRVVTRVVRTPADLERDTASPGGSIYGMSSNGWLATTRRPRNRGPIPGLFLVGGTTHPGGGIPLVLLSAAIVADMIGRAPRH